MLTHTSDFANATINTFRLNKTVFTGKLGSETLTHCDRFAFWVPGCGLRRHVTQQYIAAWTCAWALTQEVQVWVRTKSSANWASHKRSQSCSIANRFPPMFCLKRWEWFYIDWALFRGHFVDSNTEMVHNMYIFLNAKLSTAKDRFRK